MYVTGRSVQQRELGIEKGEVLGSLWEAIEINNKI